MSTLVIVRPYPLNSVAGTFEGAARLVTPDPKEAAITAGGNKTIDVDLGSVQSVDTLFLGYTNDDGAGLISVSYGSGNPAESALPDLQVAPSDLYSPRRHFARVQASPFNARYIRFTADFPANYAVGTVAVGRAFRPEWGQEWGAGRPIEDTGSVERLFGGGFGIEEGAIVGGYQWTLGDLQPAEVRALYALARSVGTTKSVLVIEDPDFTDGLNERIHWGLFRKLEAYERLDPANTRWSFQIGDWG